MGASEAAKRSLEGHIETIRRRLEQVLKKHHWFNRSMNRPPRFLVAERVQSQDRRLFSTPRHQRKATEVYWPVPGLTQQKCEDRCRIERVIAVQEEPNSQPLSFMRDVPRGMRHPGTYCSRGLESFEITVAKTFRARCSLFLD